MPAKPVSVDMVSLIRRLGAALAALVLATTLAGCAVNPVTGNKELSLYSTADEIQIGEQNYLAAQQSGGGQYSIDPRLTEYVSAVGRRLAAVSDRELPYEFVVLNDSTPNAWALPGGKIAVNRGLLLALENEAELAAVLGHEVVHAAARHGTRAMQRGTLLEVALGAAAAALGSDQALDAAALALNLTSQKYGRDAERESDYHGMKYLRAAGYDTRAAVTLQEKFVALSAERKSNWLDGLFASHPPSAERVANNRAALAEFPPGGETGRAEYQRQLAHLRAHRGAYDAAERARQLLADNPAAALAEADRAIAEVPQEPLFHGIRARALAAQNRHTAAVRAYDRAIKQDAPPGYFAHYLGRGLARQQLGVRGLAERDFEHSNRLLPTATAAYHLGALALADGKRADAKRHFAAAGQARGETGDAAKLAFTRLDLEDAPHNYLTTELVRDAGRALVRLRNPTAHPLTGVVLQVDARINGTPVTRRLTLANFPANHQADIASGIRFAAGDTVEASAQVLRARVAR